MSSKRKNDINDQQEKFCRIYAKTLSPTKAANEAGYTKLYAFQLLKKSHIVARIEEIAHAAGEKLDTEQDQILQEAAALTFSDISETADIRSLEDLKKLPLHVRHAIRKIKVKLEYGTVHVTTEDAIDPHRTSHKYLNLLEVDPKKVEKARGIVGAEIEIQMHDKHQPMRLLAMAKNLIGVNQKTPDEENDEDLVYTGIDMHLLPEQKE